jgi:hypothetical protein
MPTNTGDGAYQQRVYTEAERHAALELAATVGVRPAARQLGCHPKSLRDWMKRYPKYWSDLRAGDPAAFKKGFSYRLEDLADRYAEAEHDLLERVEGELIAKSDPKEAAALLKAMGSSRQAAVAGARTISGDPEVHEHNINFPELEKAMERLLGLGSGGEPARAADLPALKVTNEAESIDAASTSYD